MSEENANPSPTGYNKIPPRARYANAADEAMVITALILMTMIAIGLVATLVVLSWPWGLLVIMGVLSVFGTVMLVLLHRDKQ